MTPAIQTPLSIVRMLKRHRQWANLALRNEWLLIRNHGGYKHGVTWPGAGFPAFSVHDFPAGALPREKAIEELRAFRAASRTNCDPLVLKFGSILQLREHRTRFALAAFVHGRPPIITVKERRLP